MYSRCNTNLREAFEMARRLIVLADEGEAESQDDGCIVLYGVVRDCAYRIKAQAEREREAHRSRGLWDASPAAVSDAIEWASK